eukprot:NODE_374_length_8570_cov_0.578208.p3 type:complete len:142 gc:universal NODE_374_length_8570_cov_0.578208:5081-5506(+)
MDSCSIFCGAGWEILSIFCIIWKTPFDCKTSVNDAFIISDSPSRVTVRVSMALDPNSPITLFTILLEASSILGSILLISWANENNLDPNQPVSECSLCHFPHSHLLAKLSCYHYNKNLLNNCPVQNNSAENHRHSSTQPIP